VLLGKDRSTAFRVAAVLLATAGVTGGGLLLVAAGAAAGFCDWPPRPSSALGYGCGLLAGGIVLFEMALLPRKWLRGRRLGATRRWMQFHVWLGLICLPVVLAHTGLGFGGPLTAVTLTLFLAVTASGVWGLIMQQWLPQKILADVPGETVSSQVDFTGGYHAEEALRLVAGLVELGDEGFGPAAAAAGALTRAGARAEPVVTGQTAADLRTFAARILLPYLRGGARSRSSLASRAEVERRFARFRELTPPEAHPALERLEALCDLRRQWDLLVRLQVALTGLMLLHALRALKYW
jgi:hypothetical protein